MASTTPHGTRRVKASFPAPPGAPSTGIVSPWIRLASSAEPSIVSTARFASSRPSAMALPSSRLMVRPRSSWRSTIRSAAFRRIRKRSYPDSFAITRAPADRALEGALHVAPVRTRHGVDDGAVEGVLDGNRLGLRQPLPGHVHAHRHALPEGALGLQLTRTSTLMGIIPRDPGAHKGGPRITAGGARVSRGQRPSLPNAGTSRRESQTPGSGPAFGFRGPATSSTAGGVGERQTQGLTPEFDFPSLGAGSRARHAARAAGSLRAVHLPGAPGAVERSVLAPRLAGVHEPRRAGGDRRARRSRRPPPRPGGPPGPSRG